MGNGNKIENGNGEWVRDNLTTVEGHHGSSTQ